MDPLETALSTATTDELVEELRRRSVSGVVLLLRESKSGDEEYWSQDWGSEWSVLGLLSHAYRMQLKYTTNLPVFPTVGPSLESDEQL